MEVDSVFEEVRYKCDVCEHDFNREDVIKIEYGEEKYITCRKCFNELREAGN